MLLAVVALLAAPVSMTRGPLLVGVTSDSAWIVWETSDKQANGTVKFGSAEGDYTGSAQDSSYTADHHVQLTGLLPGATYHYTIDTDSNHLDSSFTTPPAEATAVPIKFVVYGDNRTNTADHQKIVNAIRAEPGIQFLVHTGDMAQNYPFSQEWDTFFSVEKDLLRNTPLFPTVGNHETLDSLFMWGQYFSPPRFDPDNTVRYYGADWGQLHFTVLDTFDKTGPAVDSNTDTISDAQMEWMKTDLDLAHARGQLVFVSLHHGAVSHAVGPDAHGGSALIAGQVVPELSYRHAIAMFAGHDHIYERGCTAGIDYMVAGGGGAPLYPVQDGGVPASVYQLRSSLAYTVFTVTGRNVTGVTKNANGITLEEFSLPSAGCQFDGGMPDPVADAGTDAGTGTTGTVTTPGAHACGSAGAATLICLIPIAFFARRRRA